MRSRIFTLVPGDTFQLARVKIVKACKITTSSAPSGVLVTIDPPDAIEAFPPGYSQIDEFLMRNTLSVITRRWRTFQGRRALLEAIQICNGLRSKYASTFLPYSDHKLRRIVERIKEQIGRERSAQRQKLNERRR